MMIYFFPAFFLLLLFFFQKKMPEDWFLLAGIVSAILCYVLLMPDNYFGGGGALGDRYFMNVFPLFFFLGYRERDFASPAARHRRRGLPLADHDGMFHSASPRYPGIFPPSCSCRKTQYATLPSNTNPRAFNKKIGDRIRCSSERQLQPDRGRIFLDLR
jgi:hypothetical protein